MSRFADLLPFSLSEPFHGGIKINDVHALNFDLKTDSMKETLPYGYLTATDPNKFPAADDPVLDYGTCEQVTPCLVRVGGQWYRLPRGEWALALDVVRSAHSLEEVRHRVFPLHIEDGHAPISVLAEATLSYIQPPSIAQLAGAPHVQHMRVVGTEEEEADAPTSVTATTSTKMSDRRAWG